MNMTRNLVLGAGAAVLLIALRLNAQEQPKANDSPVQPVPYSHKTHLARGLKCQDCHLNPDPGEHMGFPATSRCMACHATIATDRPAIQKLAGFAKSGSPIPWVRVYIVPAGTFWSHRSHLAAGMKCEMCHGEVASLDVMTRLTNVATMGGCVECHVTHKANTGCEFCHEGK